MFRLCLVGLVSAGIFGLMSALPVIGGIFEVLTVMCCVIAGLSFIIGLIKVLFFSWW